MIVDGCLSLSELAACLGYCDSRVRLQHPCDPECKISGDCSCGRGGGDENCSFFEVTSGSNKLLQSLFESCKKKRKKGCIRTPAHLQRARFNRTNEVGSLQRLMLIDFFFPCNISCICRTVWWEGSMCFCSLFYLHQTLGEDFAFICRQLTDLYIFIKCISNSVSSQST